MKTILEFKSQEPLIDINYIKQYFALTDNHEYIKNLLDRTIEHIELKRGISLQKKIWKVIHNNDLVILSFTPIVRLISVHNACGKIIEPLLIKRANDNLILQFAADVGIVKIIYEAGYDSASLPECLKISVLEQFWDLYSEDNKIYENNNVLNLKVAANIFKNNYKYEVKNVEHYIKS